MKLTEALKILQAAAAPDAPACPVVLVCGFTPLHLETFLAAHLQQRVPLRRVRVQSGLYGDAAGTLESLAAVEAEAAAIALEWQDLDPRLGFRSAGAWGPSAVAAILPAARAALGRLAAAVESAPPHVAIACSLPTLPLPPLFHTAGGQTAEAELALERELLEFAARCAARPGFTLLNRQRLAEQSPPAARYDFSSDLSTGLPYTVAHADALAAAFAGQLSPAAAKKGLITDLDDTLWHGLVGEIGPENVAWDLAAHHQLHGLYQKLLASLAEEGVLVAIASKNDPSVARQALERADLLLPAARVFPVEVHWSAKSASVERILRAWNIAADSVVFVDDSPMELAEVAAAHPGIECVPFPAGRPADGLAFLRRLRDLFGKTRLSAEDSLRLESVRHAAAFGVALEGSAAEAFLQQAEAVVTFDFDLAANEARLLELINKTNQFNLNGQRYTAAEWSRLLSRPGALLLAADYRDKFGPLGKIAVVVGRLAGDTLHIDAWAMSCRAFARRIEHQCLRALFERSGAGKIVFHFAVTARNGPLREFLAAIAGDPSAGPVAVTRRRFAAVCPPLYHRVEETPSREPWTQSQPA